MELPDLESIAEIIYARARLDPREPVVPVQLAGELFGWSNVAVEHGLERIATFDGHTLLLRAGGTPLAHDWHAAREISRWALGLFRTNPTEAAVDTLAACLRTPRVAFEPMARHLGPAFSDLSYAFMISESAAALRFGEVVGAGIALYAPGRPVRLRGRRARLSRGRTLRLGDAPGRFVRLFVA